MVGTSAMKIPLDWRDMQADPPPKDNRQSLWFYDKHNGTYGGAYRLGNWNFHVAPEVGRGPWPSHWCYSPEFEVPN